MASLRVSGLLSSTQEVKKARDIISKENDVFDYLILNVDDKDVTVKIVVDGHVIFETTPLGMYGLHLTERLNWYPYLLSYDVTNSIFVLVWEPDKPFSFKDFVVTLIPQSGTAVSYSYSLGMGIEGG